MIENIFKIINKYFGLFLEGLGATLLLTLITVIIGTILGTLLATMKLSKNKVLRAIASSYIEIIRGIPLLLQLWVIVLIFMMLGVSEYFAVLTAMGLNSAGYVAEIVRAGIQAVDKGQTEAGVSLGLMPNTVMFKIVLPQAIKNILPALGNEFVTVIKETSLASVFYIGELMTVKNTITTATYLSLEPYIIIGVIYFCVTFTLSKVIGIVEKRFKTND